MPAEDGEGAAAEGSVAGGAVAEGAVAEGVTAGGAVPVVAASGDTAPGGAASGSGASVSGASAGGASVGGASASAASGGGKARKRASRRFPSITRDTARPEGGGRAAPGDAPAPARQWPLLSVIGTVALGLVIVGLDPFDEAFRIGTILIGMAMIAGAVLRWILPSVGMLAVRSRFTDIVTYGSLGTAIVVLALMVQPDPWLQIPFLEHAVHKTVG